MMTNTLINSIKTEEHSSQYFENNLVTFVFLSPSNFLKSGKQYKNKSQIYLPKFIRCVL